MKETQITPGDNQGEEKKEDPKKMGVIGKIAGAIGFIFFLLVIIGAIMRKCGG
jgi:hypothetical protein